VLTTVISAGYYLYVVMVMFMRQRREGAVVVPRTPGWTRFVMFACAAAILILGIWPDYTVRYAAVGQPRVSAPGDDAPPAVARPRPGITASASR
ncbi:MAG: hypothetical protein HOQ19_07080, partial [Gemmatimonadaceae bacterium]|nr:hypothetical protein [Gemmatimonadaceae bacterium]